MNMGFKCFIHSLHIELFFRKLTIEKAAWIQRALTLCYKRINKCNAQTTIYVEMSLHLLVLKEQLLMKDKVTYLIQTTFVPNYTNHVFLMYSLSNVYQYRYVTLRVSSMVHLWARTNGIMGQNPDTYFSFHAAVVSHFYMLQKITKPNF